MQTNCEEIEIYPQTSGVSFMDELFLARCMVSTNEVEQTTYGQITAILSNIIPEILGT